MKLVHHHVIDGGALSLAQGLVGQDLRGAADDQRVGVDGGVARGHAHQLGAEVAGEGEELLVHQRLDRRCVVRTLALGDGDEVEERGDQGLARSGGGREDDVLPAHQLEDGLLLRGVELEALLRGPREEAVEQVFGAELSVRRGKAGGERGGGDHPWPRLWHGRTLSPRATWKAPPRGGAQGWEETSFATS